MPFPSWQVRRVLPCLARKNPQIRQLTVTGKSLENKIGAVDWRAAREIYARFA